MGRGGEQRLVEGGAQFRGRRAHPWRAAPGGGVRSVPSLGADEGTVGERIVVVGRWVECARPRFAEWQCTGGHQHRRLSGQPEVVEDGDDDRAVLRARADDADTVSETLLEILQGATRADAGGLLDEWSSRLHPLHNEPAGWSTLVAALCYLAQVSAIPEPHLASAAAALPEPTEVTFMTAAQEWFLEGKEERERAALAAVVVLQARLRFRVVSPESRRQ